MLTTCYIMMDMVLLSIRANLERHRKNHRGKKKTPLHCKLPVLSQVLGHTWSDGLLFSSCQRTLIILQNSKSFSQSSFCCKLFLWQLYKGTSHQKSTFLRSIFFLYCRAFSLEFMTWGNLAKCEEAGKNDRSMDNIFMVFCCSDGTYGCQGLKSGCWKSWPPPAEAFWLIKRMKSSFICGLSQTVNGLFKPREILFRKHH